MKYKVGDKIIVLYNITTFHNKNKYIGRKYIIKNIQGCSPFGMRYGIGKEYIVYEPEICRYGCKLC